MPCARLCSSGVENIHGVEKAAHPVSRKAGCTALGAVLSGLVRHALHTESVVYTKRLSGTTQLLV